MDLSTSRATVSPPHSLSLCNSETSATRQVLYNSREDEVQENHHHHLHPCVALQSCMELGLSHSPAPLLSILCPHSLTSDDRHPDVFIHVSYPAFSPSASVLPAIEFFIQGLFRHACYTRPSQLILFDLTNLTMEFHEMGQHNLRKDSGSTKFD